MLIAVFKGNPGEALPIVRNGSIEKLHAYGMQMGQYSPTGLETEHDSKNTVLALVGLCHIRDPYIQCRNICIEPFHIVLYCRVQEVQRSGHAGDVLSKWVQVSLACKAAEQSAIFH